MVLTILRGVFILLLAAVGWHFVVDINRPLGSHSWLAMAIALGIAVLAVFVDIVAPQRKLGLFAGTFFGLIVGILMAYALSFIVQLLVEQFMPLDAPIAGVLDPAKAIAENIRMQEALAARTSLQSFISLVVGCITCYLSISFILQSKDDFRFIIPYVEFRKQLRGTRPILLDTSALIDGRISKLLGLGLFESQIIVPRFVLIELQQVADSADRLKRARGRRGLDMLAKLQKIPKLEVVTYETPPHRDGNGVDQSLMSLAKQLEARVVTTDYNLTKVARIASIEIININELAAQMKPDALPGEKLQVKIIKPGESAGQGIGYLDDGTMVVVEQARMHINEDVEFLVTNTVQTSAGKMIFGRVAAGESARLEHEASASN